MPNPAHRLEALKGDRKGQYRVRINDQWRICFGWLDGHAYEVEIVDLPLGGPNGKETQAGTSRRDSPRGVHGHSRTEHEQNGDGFARPVARIADIVTVVLASGWAPRHHCEHRTPLRALFQKQPYLLDESTNTLRPGLWC